jgi:hypothetical protein
MNEQTFVKTTFSKFIIFNVKNTFEPNALKWVIKTISTSLIALLIIYVKIISNIQKEWCTFGRKKGHLKKNKKCLISRFEYFEHAKTFLICVKL